MPKFYENDRETARAYATDQRTSDYLEALEKVAKAAYELWKVTPHAGKPLIASCANDLYDTLEVVNFMEEEQ